MSSYVQRVEKHVIKSSNRYFKLLDEFCHLSKNLYNAGNYLIRQQFIENTEWLRYQDVEKLLRKNTEHLDYKNMPTAQTAQQTLMLLDRNWKSFFKSIKDWSKNKSKYLGMPKMPKYLKKSGRYQLILTNQNCKIKDGKLIFPKSFCGFKLKPKFIEKENFVSFQQVRFIPHKNRIVVEIVYKISIDQPKPNNSRYVGIDIGINNLATVCNTINGKPFILNGKPLKSVNQYYNKKITYMRSVTKSMNRKDYSNRMDRLTEKRNNKINDYMHKASRYVVNYCLENDISNIVIGKNDLWKQKSPMMKKVNQHFVQIPHAKFIQMIQYKAEEHGITVTLTEESYTSGTSFIDDEEPIKENYNKSRRVHRGLFKSNEGIEINADLNGAYQILKKAFPIKWDRGCVLHPVVVNV